MQSQMMAGAQDSCWYPIASSNDLPLRHVYHAQLLGHEYALWRADDGHVNLWENRCLHRGVRLSIGINDGRELKCQYHGWRYSNRTGDVPIFLHILPMRPRVPSISRLIIRLNVMDWCGRLLQIFRMMYTSQA